MPDLQEITVRLADYSDLTDAAAIVRLMQVYAQDPMGGGEALPEQAATNLVACLARISGAFTVLAFDRERSIGLVNSFEGFSTFRCRPLINIHDVIVEQPWRGKGIAGAMFDLVESIARERDCCKLTLEVLEGNVAAQRAYRKLGFDNYRLSSDTGSALFMQKSLGS